MNPFSREIMPVVIVALLFGGVAVSSAYSREKKHAGSDVREMVKVLDNIVNSPDSFPGLNGHARIDSLPAEDVATRYSGLTDKDFEMVAQELGVEIPAIKAVVVIEAGSQMKGFWAPGVPIINFDNATFSRFRRKQSGKGDKEKAKVPENLSGYALREWRQLSNARKINCRAADMATFWGMFQIGGFNYAKCGCDSVEEFVRLMSHSELEQLELFAKFITNAGMLDDLKNKNWAGFARKYNGAGYAKRGYHKKMAAAYKRFSQAEKQEKK